MNVQFPTRGRHSRPKVIKALRSVCWSEEAVQQPVAEEQQ